MKKNTLASSASIASGDGLVIQPLLDTFREERLKEVQEAITQRPSISKWEQTGPKRRRTDGSGRK